jgi:transcriptional regulator with XRE-family HTH domain
MTPNQILKQVRKERDLTTEQMAEIFGLTRARWSQFEQGDPMPIERIKGWATDARLPDWAREFARQLWLASLEQQHVALGEQIEQLGVLVSECA